MAYQNNSDDDVITLTGANGEDVDFIEIAGIAYKGNFYAILQPVELLDGMDDDEALVFRVTRNSEGEDKFNIELDDSIIDAVFREYNRLLDEEIDKANKNSVKRSSAHSAGKTQRPAKQSNSFIGKILSFLKKIFSRIKFWLPLIISIIAFVACYGLSNSNAQIPALAAAVVGGVSLVWFLFRVVRRIIRKLRRR